MNNIEILLAALWALTLFGAFFLGWIWGDAHGNRECNVWWDHYGSQIVVSPRIVSRGKPSRGKPSDTAAGEKE